MPKICSHLWTRDCCVKGTSYYYIFVQDALYHNIHNKHVLYINFIVTNPTGIFRRYSTLFFGSCIFLILNDTLLE
jgi:hypothetical protein